MSAEIFDHFSSQKVIHGPYRPEILEERSYMNRNGSHISGRKAICGPHGLHISGRKSIYRPYGPHISGRKSICGLYGPSIYELGT